MPSPWPVTVSSPLISIAKETKCESNFFRQLEIRSNLLPTPIERTTVTLGQKVKTKKLTNHRWCWWWQKRSKSNELYWTKPNQTADNTKSTFTFTFIFGVQWSEVAKSNERNENGACVCVLYCYDKYNEYNDSNKEKNTRRRRLLKKMASNPFVWVYGWVCVGAAGGKIALRNQIRNK